MSDMSETPQGAASNIDALTVNNGGPLKPRDYFCLLEIDFDPDAQMDAIQSLLEQHGDLADDTRQAFEKRQEFAKQCKGAHQAYVEGGCAELFYYSIYQYAAHSMAAVGMLAPSIETLFTQSFAAIGRQYFTDANQPTGHERWSAASQQAWDCRQVFTGGRRRTDIVAGIMQMADATGLSKHLPKTMQAILGALFAYRNKMFHHGFEWPADERKKFAQRIENENWPADWFGRSTSSDEPWIFYMSHKFIDECQLAYQKVLDAFGELVRELHSKRSTAGRSQAGNGEAGV